MASLSESGQYYKVGNDVFRTSDNAHIDLATFQKLGLNFALLPEGQATAQKISGIVPIGQSASVSASNMGMQGVPTGGTASSPTYSGQIGSAAYVNAKAIASNPYANPAEKADAIKYLQSVDPSYSAPSQQINPNTVSGVYAQGNDVYAVVNGTPTHIDQNQFQSLGLNFSFLKQGTPVSLTEGQTGSPQGTVSQTGDPAYDTVLSKLNETLQNITNRGLAVNPYFDFSSPEGLKKVAEFTAQAQNEIDPYYANQLTQARAELLRNIGYSADQISVQEKQYETQYGLQVTAIGEQAAEQGFAQSGKRMLQEQQLASDTQFNLEQARKSAQYKAGTQVAGFGQKFGELPTAPTISETPTVVAGQRTFQKSPIQTPLYSISPDLYAGISSQQQEKTVAEQNRISQLESAFSQDYSAQQQRKLTL